jgi:hypothetical protein
MNQTKYDSIKEVANDDQTQIGSNNVSDFLNTTMFVNDVSRGNTGRPQFNEQFDKTQMIKGDVSLPFQSPIDHSLLV